MWVEFLTAILDLIIIYYIIWDQITLVKINFNKINQHDRNDSFQCFLCYIFFQKYEKLLPSKKQFKRYSAILMAQIKSTVLYGYICPA